MFASETVNSHCERRVLSRCSRFFESVHATCVLPISQPYNKSLALTADAVSWFERVLSPGFASHW